MTVAPTTKEKAALIDQILMVARTLLTYEEMTKSGQIQSSKNDTNEVEG